MNTNRQATYRTIIPKNSTGDPKLNVAERERLKLRQLAQSYNPMIADSLKDLAQKTEDPAVRAQIEEASKRDIGGHMLDRIYARKNTQYANMDDKINRFGEILSLDEIPRYTPDQGPFDQWLQDKMEEAHDRTDAEHKREFAKTAGYRGRSLSDTTKLGGEESKTQISDTLADPNAVIPGESEDERLQRIARAEENRSAAIAKATPKTNQDAIREPKMVARQNLGLALRDRRRWNSPLMSGLREEISRRVGPGGLRVFNSLARGDNEGELIESFSNRRAYQKYKAAVVNLMREELEGRDPAKRELLNGLELMLDTDRSREQPLRRSAARSHQ
jgi:hypothetical protein